MHPASLFRQDDRSRLTDLVRDRSFALIAAASGDRPFVAHAPVIVAGDRLRFHLAASNPLCPALKAGAGAVAIVSGPDAYVSPDWYAAADQVPTWNYVAAEMEGPVRILTASETTGLLDDLSAHFEARLAPKPPWTRAKMNAAKFAAMLNAITGFEMTIARFSGVSKLSQNKPAAEIARVAQGLAERPDAGSRQIADLMTADRER